MRAAASRPHQELLAQGLLDAAGQSALALQIGLGVLAALAQALALIEEPGAGLLHELRLDAQVEQVALARDAVAVHHVELGLAERRGDLVLDDLDARAVADDLRRLP